jgi:hypothetical protein
MFDDIPKNQQGAGTPPGNLPIGEPEDMFKETDPVAPQQPQAPASPMQSEPIGGPVKEPTPAAEAAASQSPVSAMEAGVLQPKGVQTPSMAPPPDMAGQPRPQQPASLSQPYDGGGSMPPPVGPPPQMSGPVLTKGIAITLVTLVVLLILGGGGWWIYTAFIKAPDTGIQTTQPIIEDDTAMEMEQDVQEDEVPVEATTSTSEQAQEISDDQQDKEVLFGPQSDEDADGILDLTETEFGTDPRNWDSDGDELSDGDEVFVWETDPLNPDTDGDGYLDGLEVQSGYSPTGPGRLFEVTTTPATSTDS